MTSNEKPAALTPERLLSLDAYRGLVMVALASSGFGIARAARNFPESDAWQAVSYQFEHVPWVGCSFWDLIQPSFMFMVGVSMAYSYSKRERLGHTYGQMFRHAAFRAVVLILLGVFLRSNRHEFTHYTVIDVISQIGLGYIFLFMLRGHKPLNQFAWAMGVLVGYWALFAFYPAPPVDFDYTTVGAPESYQPLTGFAAHWNWNTNPAAYFDVWFLNLFPRQEPLLHSPGGYATLNFIPSLATMIFGLMVGELVRGDRSAQGKFWWLVFAGVAGLAAGQILNLTGVCPLVKRIWTPSWTLFSTGWACLILASFYGVIDRLGFRRWAFPLVIVGLNSIAVYCMAKLIPRWSAVTLQTHFGVEYAERIGISMYYLACFRSPWSSASVSDSPIASDALRFGEAFAPVILAMGVLAVVWLLCLWLYRQRIFFRI